MIAYTGLVGLASIGAAALFASVPKRHLRIIAGSIVGLLILLELRAAPLRWYHTVETPPVYRWLSDAPISGAVVELPLDKSNQYEVLLRSTVHRRPLINGVSGFAPPHFLRLQGLANGEVVSDEFLPSITALGASLVIIHGDRLGASLEATRDWLRREIARGNLVLLSRFDDGMQGTWVFAINGMEPNLDRLASGGTDPTGLSDPEKLQQWLEGREVYSGRAFGWIDRPEWGSTIGGPLQISGWAFSPHEVREVRIHLAGSQIVRRAERAEYPALRSLYPWYPESLDPLFALEMAERPWWIDPDTDLHVEIIDGRGKSTTLVPGAVVAAAPGNRGSRVGLGMDLGTVVVGHRNREGRPALSGELITPE